MTGERARRDVKRSSPDRAARRSRRVALSTAALLVLAATLVTAAASATPATAMLVTAAPASVALVTATSATAVPLDGEPVAPAVPLVRGPRVVFLGDSITAGTFAGRQHAFPACVGDRLAAAGHPIRVVNAGVHGNTAEAAVARLAGLAAAPIDLLVVELGGNDGLRDLPLDALEEQLRLVLAAAAAEGVPTLLLGMRIPEVFGREHAEAFAAIYDRLAEDFDVAYVPFFMEDAASHSDGMGADGIHPTRLGHELMAEAVAPALLELVVAWEERHGREPRPADCVFLDAVRHLERVLARQPADDPTARARVVRAFAETMELGVDGPWIDKGLHSVRETWSFSSDVASREGPLRLVARVEGGFDGEPVADPVAFPDRRRVVCVLDAERAGTTGDAPCGDGRPFSVLVGHDDGFFVLRWPEATWWGLPWRLHEEPR